MLTVLKWILSVLMLVGLTAGSLYVIAGMEQQPLDDAARAKAPGAFIALTEGQVHYRWDGPEEGPVVVMVHGFSTPHFIFEQNAEALGAAGFRVLRFDHFGRGWSDRPPGPYDIEFYDRALLELVDGLGLDAPFGLVGLSMGGPITAEFTARRPERVSRLFLLVPAGFDVPGSKGAAAALVRAPVLGDWIWRMFGRAILLGEGAGAEGLEPGNRLAGDIEVQMGYRGYHRALLSTLRHFPLSGREDSFARLSETGVPVRAVFGDADKTIQVSSAEAMQIVVPMAEIEVFEGGTHSLNYERHDEVSPKLVSWFGASD